MLGCHDFIVCPASCLELPHHLRPAVGSGLILWLPKGAMVRSLLESFIREEF